MALALSEPPLCLHDSRCRRLARAAERAFGNAAYEEALRLYQQALVVVPDPRLMRNIGQSLHKLGRYSQALAYFKRTQLTVHDPELAAQLKRDLADAQAALDQLLLSQQPRFLPSEPVQAVPPESRERPKWRLGLGSATVVAGLSALGIGGYGAWLNGACKYPDQPVELCSPYYDTRLPAGLSLGAGALLTLGGVILLAVPGRRRGGR